MKSLGDLADDNIEVFAKFVCTDLVLQVTQLSSNQKCVEMFHLLLDKFETLFHRDDEVAKLSLHESVRLSLPSYLTEHGNDLSVLVAVARS